MLEHRNRIDRLSYQLTSILDLMSVADELAIDIQSMKGAADLCLELYGQIITEISEVFDSNSKE